MGCEVAYTPAARNILCCRCEKPRSPVRRRGPSVATIFGSTPINESPSRRDSASTGRLQADLRDLAKRTGEDMSKSKRMVQVGLGVVLNAMVAGASNAAEATDWGTLVALQAG